MSDILTAFSGAKRSDSGGRTVVDKLYGLKGNLNPVFAGADRPEFHKTLDGFEQVCVEKESENLIARSEEFDNVYWSKLGGGTGSAPVVTANEEISPKGDMTADKIFFDAGIGDTNSDVSLLAASPNVVEGDNNGSIWLKGEVGGEKIVFRHVAAGVYTTLSLTTEWKRFDITENGSAKNFQFGVRGSVSSSATVFAWGAQLEQSAYPTNYIPTQGTTVTRLAPSPVIENALPETGTVAGVVRTLRDPDSSTNEIFEGGGSSNRSILYRLSSGSLNSYIRGTDNVAVINDFFLNNDPYHISSIAYIISYGTENIRLIGLRSDGTIKSSSVSHSLEGSFAPNVTLGGRVAQRTSHYFEKPWYKDNIVRVNATDAEIKQFFEDLTRGTSMETAKEDMVIVE